MLQEYEWILHHQGQRMRQLWKNIKSFMNEEKGLTSTEIVVLIMVGVAMLAAIIALAWEPLKTILGNLLNFGPSFD